MDFLWHHHGFLFHAFYISLKEKYPKFKKHFENKTLRIAINQEYTNTNKKINKNDEIAFFPPVSGG